LLGRLGRPQGVANLTPFLAQTRARMAPLSTSSSTAVRRSGDYSSTIG